MVTIRNYPPRGTSGLANGENAAGVSAGSQPHADAGAGSAEVGGTDLPNDGMDRGVAIEPVDAGDVAALRERGASGATHPQLRADPSSLGPSSGQGADLQDLFNAKGRREPERWARLALDTMQQLTGPLNTPQLPSEPIALGRRDHRHLKRLVAAIKQVQELPEERRQLIAETLRSDWLPLGLDAKQLSLRVELAALSGYCLVDAGPSPNPYDSTGWSNADLSDIHDILSHLPSSMKSLPTLSFLTRDARSQAEDKALHELSAGAKATDEATDPASSRTRRGGLGLIPAKTLAKLIRSLNIGASFGHAIWANKEVRLYNELFFGSRVPGLHRMLAYTTLHEIAHHELQSSQDLRQSFAQLYFFGGGKDEAPNGYAGSDLDEGFAVAVGMYAVAPDKLKARSPKTYAFMEQRYGDALDHFHGKGLEGEVINLVYGVGDKIA